MEILANKIILNEEIVIEGFNGDKNEEISSNYFYNSWINSFEIEENKKDKTYQHFIKKTKYHH